LKGPTRLGTKSTEIEERVNNTYFKYYVRTTSRTAVHGRGAVCVSGTAGQGRAIRKKCVTI
jgi:hypothetical protein